MSQQSPAHDDPAAHHSDTQRLEAFSDGVFAIAITLLIIEIAVPHVRPDGSLTRGLLDLWPSYLGYVISFLTIGIMWINHHHMFKDIVRVDHTLLVLNLFLLLGIAFVPFPTATLAEYLREGEHQVEATLAYGCTFVVLALLFDALWLYPSWRMRLIDAHVSEARVRSRTLRYLPGPLLYGLGLPLAFISPWISLSIFMGLGVFWLLPLNE
ncbi:MAG: TMEM175 family protein [Dehalococcoidia bacterium]